MRIESIDIKNYRQYKRMHFDFIKTKNDKYDLFAVIAQNGVGKSNFLNSITWCLYKKEPHLQDEDNALPIVNTKVLNEMKIGTSTNVEIEMKVIDTNNTDYTFKRVATYVKTDNKTKPIIEKSNNISVKFKSMNDRLGYPTFFTLDGEAAVEKTNQIFPEGISEYFFFDNEQMDNYFKNTQNTEIKKAINEISKVSLVQSLGNHLEAVANDYSRNIGTTDNSIEVAREYYEKCKKEALFASDEYKKIREYTDKVEKEIEELNRSLKNVEDIEKLENDYQENKNQIERLAEEKAELEKELDNFIMRYTVLINMYKSLKATEDLIEEKEKAGTLPPKIGIEVLRKMESDKACEVCGSTLNDEAIDRIKKMIIKVNMSQPVSELLIGVRSEVTNMLNEVRSYKKERDSLISKYQNIEEESDKLVEINCQITDKMKLISNKDEIKQMIEKRKMLEDNKTYSYLSAGDKGRVFKDKKEEKEKAEKTLNDLIKKQSKSNEANRLYLFTKTLKEKCDLVEKTLIEEMRVEISNKTFSFFQNMIWKRDTYTAVEIDENYVVKLMHKMGINGIGTTSAAERALLALSFTNAIHSVSGLQNPLVIDSPVGRVSDINRKKFAESISNISKEKQVIMFFTPDEYSEDISDVFDLYATKFHAKMADDEEETIIKGDV